uniref:Tyrosine-protein kinase ephrin type A/B receptor-like domain-containing protein n=1 Tax=Romanomermis culicivorax TaxID=13658 RepID=A0A915JKU0_ROMCU
MNGTYSKSGQSACSSCQPGTFSEKGMTTCKNCDASKTYSDFQSSYCVIRPPCTSEDYSPIYLFCQSGEKATVSYDWLRPKTCSDTIQSAVKLPQPLKSNECNRCNVGQKMTPTGCRFCPQGFYSDGKSAGILEA